MMDALEQMGKKATEDEIGNIQQMTDKQPATVQFLDFTKHIFYVSKKAEGGELFDKVCAFIGLSERDYFALSFSDDEGNQHWIYDDKRISKQLKGHPWNFNFKVKFYPPEPATLAEDRTRHLLCLQVQHDISTGKLPATLATHALLGSYVAQSVRGDYEPSLEYIDFLKNCNLAPLPNETLYEKIEELHRHHKGQTPAEADLHYLENAKKLSMYGVQLFHAKDAKSTPVQIGISAHGINIYLDQIRVHRFLWQNIIKIGYRRNIFVIKVKPGELEKNESTTAFKLPDYEAAKRVWKCGVEHHTFFRLIQPEEKPHKGLFRWGSARFRYQGRTQFQSKMASQMFCNNQPIQRSQSVRMAEDDRNTVPVSVSQTLPLIYSEDRTCRELGWRSNQMISPEKMYSMHVTDDTQNVENNAMLNGAEVGNTNNTSGKLLDNVYSSDIFATSVATTVTSNAAITTSTIVTSTGNTAADQYSKQTSSFHASPNSTKVSRNTGPFMHEFSDDSIPRYKSDDLFENRANISALRKDNDAGFLPVKDTAVVYHPGHYEQEMTGSRGIREPPVELGDDFVLVHRPKLTSTGKIFHHNGAETNILIREEDIETYPVPCLPRSTSEKKDFEKKKFEREKYLGTDDYKLKVNKENYPTNENFKGPILHMERSMELPTEPLTTYVYVYNQGYYDTVDPNRTDIDEKGNMRYWLRCYRKPEKSQTKLLKEKSIETRKNTEKNKSKLVRDNQAASKIGSVNEQENETQKIALIHVKQPGHERQIVQSSYYNMESPEKRLPETACLKGSKSVTVGIDADKSFSSDIMEETYDSTQPKQTCRLFISTSDSGHVRPGAYGVPSTSHDELLHNIRREEELPSLPIHEHAAICHPGISVIKDRKRRKFLIRKEKQKTSSSETSTDAEVPIDERKKYTSVIHISDADKNNLADVDDVEKGAINEKIAKKHMKYEMEEKKYLDQMKDGFAVDSEMQKSTHKIKKDTKLDDVQNIQSENNHQKMKAVLYLSKDQGKPLSSNMKAKPALRKTEESKDVKHAMLPVYNELATGNLLEKSEKAKRSEQPQIEHILDNTPPPVKLSRINEISFQPIHLVVKVQNQVQNPSRNYRTFKRAKHGGTVEFVAKENIDPASYKYECTPYQGPLEIIHFENGLQFAPIHDYSAVYHPGNTYVKSRKIKKRTNASEFQNEHKPSPMKIKQTAVLHLNKDDSDAKHQEEEKSDSGAFLSKNENLVTTYRAKIACKTPAKERTKVKKHPFQYRTITGDVEIIEKCFVKPETYGLVTVPYDGPLSCLEYGKELSFIPLQEYSSIYHSGISYKKARRLRDSSTESSSSASSSSSSSTSSTNASEKHEELEKKIMLRNKYDVSDNVAESAKHKRIFSFWRKSFRSEKEGDFPDDSKQKLEISSKSQYVQPQQQPELSESRTSTSPSQLVSTVLVKDSVKESKTDSYVKSKSKKMTANLYLKDEPSTTLENGENNSKHGKFDLFHFWRSADKESTIDHTADFNSLREEANIGLTTKGKKKPIIRIDKDASSRIKASELARSKDMEEESLKHSSLSPSNQDITNVETKKNVFNYLKRNSELYDGLPLDLRSTPEISKQEITTTAMTTVSSSDQANVTQMLPKTNEDVGYTAKITVKREIRSIDDLQQDSDLKVKGTNAPNDDINKKPNFIVKGFHLRGPPCESEVIHSSARYTPEKDTELTEATETSEVTVTKRHESDSVNSANKLITRGKVGALKIKKEKLIEGDVNLNGSKKDGGKSSRSGFFSSLWRGSKSKDSDQDEHQKQQKLIKSDIHGIELTPVNTTSPTSELEYNILRTKVIFGSGHKEVKPSSNVARGGEQIRQDYVPVYDFSYIPNFAAFVENGEVTPATTAADMKQTEMMIVEDSVRKPDEIITGKAANETAAPPESHDESWRNVSQLNWEKLDTKMTEEHTIQCVESETFEDGKLFYQSEISSGEALDEPYIFTQTPPDIPVPMVYPTNPEASADFVEQIKRQVTQAVSKATPSLDIRKKLKKEKKRTMINPSLLHESENSNAPEIEAASHHDFLSANQSKESADKPEVINEWPSEGTKLDNQHLLLEEHKQEMYDLKNAEGVPTIHSTDTADSLPHTNFESWQKTINEPETVITTIDHHGNITKKTIKTQQVTHTVQQQMYQTSSASNQNNDSETKKSRIPSENVASFQTSVVGTPGHNLAYESADGVDNINGNDYSDIPGELVSSRTVTQGNRTIETITYKTEKNGVVETHVEHRVTIHSCDDIDHDTELNQAILEATNMNPDMTVEKIEVKHESQC
ncbi:Band 4.1-like protein [Dirofilaria immitis]